MFRPVSLSDSLTLAFLAQHKLTPSHPTPTPNPHPTMQVPANVMDKLWVAMAKVAFEPVRAAVADIIAEGYPLGALLSQLLDDVVARATLTDLSKALICEKIAQADQCLADGSSESLQLLDVAAFVQRQITKNVLAVDTVVGGH